MNETEVNEVLRESIIVMLQVSAPLMFVALAVGLIVSLFQALTQIQEMTLAFVPKIFFIYVAAIFLMPYMIRSLIEFSETLFDRMISLG